MPRAEYDTVAEVYWGANTATPGAFKRLQVGRFVPLPRVRFIESIWASREGYFTYNGPLLLAGSPSYIPFILEWEIDAADIIRIPSTGLPDLYVMFNELIIPRFGVTPYRRAHLSVY